MFIADARAMLLMLMSTAHGTLLIVYSIRYVIIEHVVR